MLKKQEVQTVTRADVIANGFVKGFYSNKSGFQFHIVSFKGVDYIVVGCVHKIEHSSFYFKNRYKYKNCKDLNKLNIIG